jgi:MFS family permease
MGFSALLFLTALNVLNYLDRYLLAALLPLISADLSLSHTKEGILVAAFVIGYTFFAPIFGSLGDKRSRVVLMVVGVAVWSLATLLCGLVEGFLALIAVRVLVGIGEASYGTIAPGYIRDRLDNPQKLGDVLAIFFAAIPIGSALGYVLGGLIAEASSWRVAFMVCAVPGILGALILARFKEATVKEAAQGSFIDGVKTILESKILKIAIIGYILNSFALNGIAAFVASYGIELGFSHHEITAAFGVLLVASGFFGTVLGGKLSAALARRSANPLPTMLLFCGVCSLISAPFVGAAFLVSNKIVFLIFCFLGELLIFATTAPVNTVLLQAAPQGRVTLTQGVTILGLNLLGALPAPIIFGACADGLSLKIAMQVATVALVLSGLVWVRGHSKSGASV